MASWRFTFTLVFLVLLLSACSSNEQAPSSEPLRGWGGEPVAAEQIESTTSTLPPQVAFAEDEPPIPDEGFDPDDFTYGEKIGFTFRNTIDEFSNEQLRCIDDEIVDFNTSGSSVPEIIVEHVGRLCAPERAARIWASSESISLSDSDDRVCFAEVVIEVANSQFWDNIQWFQSMRFDPPNPQRDRVDDLLATRCDIDIATGVIAGLRDRGPLQPNDQLTAYCAAVAERATTPGYGPGADNETTLAWLQRELFAFTNLSVPDHYQANHNLRLLAVERAFLLAVDGATFDELHLDPDYISLATDDDIMDSRVRIADFEATNCSQ